MRIDNKVRVTFGIQVLLIALLGAAALISYNLFRAASENLDAARQAHILALETRRREKDFLLENDATKADLAREHVAAVEALLGRMAEDGSEKTRESVRAATAAVKNYRTAFDAMVAADVSMGLTDDLGYRGAMRKRVHAAEKEIQAAGNIVLSNGMLSLRRHEKDFLLRNDAVYVAKHEKTATEFFSALNAAELPPAVRDSVRAAMNEYISGFAGVVAEQAKRDAALARAKAAAHELEPQFATMVSNFEAEMDAARSSGRMQILVLAGIAVLLGSWMGWMIARRLTWILQQLSGSVGSGAQQVLAASEQVCEAGQQLATGASEQASSIEETSASLEEMASRTRQSADNAVMARDLADRVRSAADGSEIAMKDMDRAMNEIKDASDSVAKIIKAIDEIAFQTNLLALNAAVEAARAGDAGRGFGVVAGEVRSLAQRAATAARESAEMIELATSRTQAGVENSKRVSVALLDVSASARRAHALIGEIAAAATEQSQGIEQIAIAVQQIDKVVQSNAAGAEEAASAAEELTAQAHALKEAVGELQDGGGAQRIIEAEAVREFISVPMAKSPLLSTSRKAMARAQIPLVEIDGVENGNGFHSRAETTGGSFKRF